MRYTLVSGFAMGAIGTAALALGFDSDGSYLTAVPGLIIMGVGQGIAWTAMWIAAAAGVAPEEQGVASGMAATTLNVGNAIGLAILIAVANAGIDGQQGQQLRDATADGSRTAVLLAAVGILLGALVARRLPRLTASIGKQDLIGAEQAAGGFDGASAGYGSR